MKYQGSPTLTVLTLLISVWLQIDVVAVAESLSPLADAAEQQDAAAVRQLLEQSVDVDATQADGMTALHWAVRHDNSAMVAQLMAAGADADVANRYGVRPLPIACTNGSQEVVQALLQHGADPNAAQRGGETPLMTAARTGRLGPVRALLAAGADVMAEERKGQTALMWAAAEGHLAVTRALLEAGANRQATLKSGFTPFLFAVREGKTEVARALIDAGDDVHQTLSKPGKSGREKPGPNPLLLALENGHFETAVMLLKRKANPNAAPLSYAPLHAMTWVRKPLRGDGAPAPIGSGNLSSLEFVRQLVFHGADPNVRHGKAKPMFARLNMTGITPLMLAARTGDLEMMRLLVDLGADPHLANVDGCTALLAAAGVGALSNGDETAGTEAEAVAAVEYLMSLGLSINTVDANGETALHGAAYKSWPTLIRFLADHGAQVETWNQKNRHGWTPLMIAEGHRPGNFRPSPDTILAVQSILPQ